MKKCINTIEDLIEWLDSDPDYDLAVEVVTTCLGDATTVDQDNSCGDSIKALKQRVIDLVTETN